MRIIINADDLGSSVGVNDEIFTLMTDVKISSASLMANGPAFEEAVTKIRLFKEYSFGCHLNLTEFKPLTNSQIMRDFRIIDESGFTGKLREVSFKPSLLRELYIELEQQIIKVLDNKIHISHIDSHQHIHTIPALFLVFKKIQKKFKIRKVRISMNYYGMNYNPGIKKKLAKYFWNLLLRNYYRTKTTDFFASAAIFANNMQVMEDKVMEIMCHPGSPFYSSETEILKSDWLNYENIKLISYNKL